MLEIVPPTLNLAGAILLAAFVLWDDQKVERHLTRSLSIIERYFSDAFPTDHVTPASVVRLTFGYGLFSIILFAALAALNAIFEAKPGIVSVALVFFLILSFFSFVLNSIFCLIFFLIAYANHDRERERRLGLLGAILLCLGYAVDIWLRI